MAAGIVGAIRESVLAEAVRAYTLARKRGSMQKSAAGREEVQALAKDFPEAYLSQGKSESIKFIGRSADEILEDYLQGIGKPRRSKLWFELAGIVVARGERVE